MHGTSGQQAVQSKPVLANEHKRNSRSLWKSVLRCFSDVKEKEADTKPSGDSRSDEATERINAWLHESKKNLLDMSFQEDQLSRQIMKNMNPVHEKEVRHTPSSETKARPDSKDKPKGKKNIGNFDLTEKGSVFDSTLGSSFRFLSSPLAEKHAVHFQNGGSSSDHLKPTPAEGDLTAAPSELWFGSSLNFGPFLCVNARK